MAPGSRPRVWLLAPALLLGCASTPPSRPPPEWAQGLDPLAARDPGSPDLNPGEVSAGDDDVQPVDFPSCEQARDDNVESVDLSSPSGSPADITASEYAAILGRGTYLQSCGVPSSVAVDVCAAVVNGGAVGITVTMAPHDQRLINCVVEAIRVLAFPSHPRMDIARSRFAATD